MNLQNQTQAHDAAQTLPKQMFCENCGRARTNSHSIVAHHDDYARPLEVRWLCASCHQCWHVINGPGANKVGSYFNLRLPEALHAALKAEAGRLGISLNALILIRLQRNEN